MVKIPKPVTAKKPAENFDAEHLKEWKALFEGIDKNISVVLKEDEEFYETKKEVYGGHEFSSDMWESVIIVILPSSFGSLVSLIGLNYNRMFSNQDIEADELLDKFPCEPELNTWEYHYEQLIKIREGAKNKVKRNPAFKKMEEKIIFLRREVQKLKKKLKSCN